MRFVTTPAEVQAVTEQWRSRGSTVGFVPTMGALHAGHLSLFSEARRRCDAVVASVFVNPTQFNDAEDFERYPRNTEKDAQAARECGVDLFFAPPVHEMYPPSPVVSLSVAGALAESFEARFRPGHFAGVVTVVAKLFWMVGSCTAFFGEKDYQQLLIVRRLAQELCRGVEVVGCPIVRESDGLAMSSRNSRLSVEDRRAATVLRRALVAAEEAVVGGGCDPESIVAVMKEEMRTEPSALLDYAAVVDGDDLGPLTQVRPGARALLAATIGGVRLIDNTALGGIGEAS